MLRRFQFPGRCLGGGARYLGTSLSHDVMRLKVAGPLQELSLNVHTPQQLRTTTKVMLSPQTLLSSLNFGVAFQTNTDHHSQICLPKLLAAPRSCKRAPSRSEYFGKLLTLLGNDKRTSLVRHASITLVVHHAASDKDLAALCWLPVAP